MDIVPVMFGSGKRYFGSVAPQHLLENPDVVFRGDRVLRLSHRALHQQPALTRRSDLRG